MTSLVALAVKLIVLVIILGVIVTIIEILRGKGKETTEYQYKHKNFFMTRAEHECYDALVRAVGDRFYVFPQVHLPSIIDNKVIGQNWKSAFRHINSKSVDFVLCDKAYISPRLAIELDDYTHERQDRINRDEEVEGVLRGAGLPLLRLKNHGHFNSLDLAKKIDPYLTRINK